MVLGRFSLIILQILFASVFHLAFSHIGGVVLDE